MRLLPREEKFHDLFHSQVTLILDAARTLAAAVKSGPAAMPAAAAHIDGVERQGDQLVIELFRRLNKTFITPLDPEDIQQLGSHLDNILDYLENVVHCLDAYEIDPIPTPIAGLADLIVQCAGELEKALLALSRNEPILDYCLAINRLEEDADLVHRRAVAGLFREVKDPILIIKCKEILDLLENTADACEDASDVLQTVAVKNS